MSRPFEGEMDPAAWADETAPDNLALVALELAVSYHQGSNATALPTSGRVVEDARRFYGFLCDPAAVACTFPDAEMDCQ